MIRVRALNLIARRQAHSRAVSAPESICTLAIESSCDDTSVAVLERHIWPNTLQEKQNDEDLAPLRTPFYSYAVLRFHAKITAANQANRGIDPVKALQSHQENLSSLTRKALSSLPLPSHDERDESVGHGERGKNEGRSFQVPYYGKRRIPDFIAVTQGPGMRSNLSVGLDTAKGLAVAWGIPLVGVHHMQAHLLTPRLKHELDKCPDPEMTNDHKLIAHNIKNVARNRVELMRKHKFLLSRHEALPLGKESLLQRNEALLKMKKNNETKLGMLERKSQMLKRFRVKLRQTKKDLVQNEKDLAQNGKSLAQNEKDLAQNEKDLAQNEKDLARTYGVSSRPAKEVNFPFLSLLVSGGHTMLVYTKGLTEHQTLGSTRDIALGEALDKIGRDILPQEWLRKARLEDMSYARLLSEYAFPMPHSQLGTSLQEDQIDSSLPREHYKRLFEPYKPSMNREQETHKTDNIYGWHLSMPLSQTREIAFSFSGIVTRTKQLSQNISQIPPFRDAERILLARTALTVTFEHLASKIVMVLNSFRESSAQPELRSIVVSGGVASNLYLREVLRKFLDAREFRHVRLVFPPASLCTDNAAMIAWAGMEMFIAGYQSGLECEPLRKWEMDSRGEGMGILGSGKYQEMARVAQTTLFQDSPQSFPSIEDVRNIHEAPSRLAPQEVVSHQHIAPTTPGKRETTGKDTPIPCERGTFAPKRKRLGKASRESKDKILNITNLRAKRRSKERISHATPLWRSYWVGRRQRRPRDNAHKQHGTPFFASKIRGPAEQNEPPTSDSSQQVNAN